LAQPWAMACPAESVRVRHHLVAGSRASIAARARESSASRMPNPGTWPGDWVQPSHAASGMVRFTVPRSVGSPGPGPGPGVPVLVAR
jgi:hypothetical protein